MDSLCKRCRENGPVEGCVLCGPPTITDIPACDELKQALIEMKRQHSIELGERANDFAREHEEKKQFKRERDEAREYSQRQHEVNMAATQCVYGVIRDVLKIPPGEALINGAKRVAAERDEARGMAALIHEAYWLAVADLPHSDECAVAECRYERACKCECSCWRSAADKIDIVAEQVNLCTQVRDLEDECEALRGSATASLDAIEQWSQHLARRDQRIAELEAALREIEKVHDGLEHASGEFSCPAYNHECFEAPPDKMSSEEYEAPCPLGDDHVLEMCECCLRCTLIARATLSSSPAQPRHTVTTSEQAATAVSHGAACPRGLYNCGDDCTDHRCMCLEKP